jgi:hypothetical protein
MRGLSAAAAALAIVLAGAAATPATAKPRPALPTATYSIIGDTPYGDAQIAGFPSDIAQINADPDVRLVVHLGDIKNGSSRCDTSYFEQIRANFETFADPLVYTPGDNEWTDCHRANNGGYQPDERLAEVRRLFFDRPGHTLGADRRVIHQGAPYVENVLWSDAGTVFGTLNVPGSNNDLAPWFDDAETDEQRARQLDEYGGRLVADLLWLDQIFDVAQNAHAKAVVIGVQADMWDPAAVAANQVSGFTPFIKELRKRARQFHKPVLLLNGDSHVYEADHPINGAANLTRITVQGSTSTPHEWLKLKIDPNKPGVFSWTRIPFGAP